MDGIWALRIKVSWRATSFLALQIDENTYSFAPPCSDFKHSFSSLLVNRITLRIIHSGLLVVLHQSWILDHLQGIWCQLEIVWVRGSALRCRAGSVPNWAARLNSFGGTSRFSLRNWFQICIVLLIELVIVVISAVSFYFRIESWWSSFSIRSFIMCSTRSAGWVGRK